MNANTRLTLLTKLNTDILSYVYTLDSTYRRIFSSTTFIHDMQREHWRRWIRRNILVDADRQRFMEALDEIYYYMHIPAEFYPHQEIYGSYVPQINCDPHIILYSYL